VARVVRDGWDVATRLSQNFTMISKWQQVALLPTFGRLSSGLKPAPKPNGALKARNDCTAPCGYYNQWFTQECCSDNSVCITDAFTSANANQHCDSDSASPDEFITIININDIEDIGLSLSHSLWSISNESSDSGASSGQQRMGSVEKSRRRGGFGCGPSPDRSCSNLSGLERTSSPPTRRWPSR
ncbi:hypothetical protein HII31_00494, partial [Pseudocercospora fuligena]